MKHLNLLIKPASSECNMHCEYCFYKDESRNRAVYSYGRMSLETLETTVKNALSQCTVSCSFMFQGGEPTLAGLDFYKALVDYQTKYNVNKIQLFNSIQTNGYNLSEDWAEFFSKENFLVGVSLDGDKIAHDAFRFCGDSGTFDNVMHFISLLDKHKCEYNILSVVTAASAHRAGDIYAFFKANGFRYLQFISCLDAQNSMMGSREYSLTPKLYAKFFKELFDCWYDDCRRHEGISIRNFDNYLMMLSGRPPENCGMNGRCSLNAVIEADGSVYPCDFYALDEYRLGNINFHSFEDMFSSAAANSFLNDSPKSEECCKRCRYFPLCRGGCRREKAMGEQGEISYFCPGIRSFFDYSLARLQEVASMKQQPYVF